MDENPSLKAYDLATPEGLYEFYTAVSVLADTYQLGPKGLKLVAAMERATENITDMLEDMVLSHVEDLFKKFPAFEAEFKKMFTFQGTYQPEYFITNEEDGKRFPHVRMNGTNPMSKGRGYAGNLARYAGQRGDVATMTIVPQSAMRLDPQTEKIVDSTAPTAAGPLVVPPVEPVLPGGPKEGTDSKAAPPVASTPSFSKPAADYFDANDAPFRISDEYEAASEDDIQRAVNWLREVLPQFDVNREDLQEIIDLTKIDGAVLGMFKDRVIYLNNSMLSKGIVYHEAFHGVFRYLMTESKRRELLDKVQGDKRYASRFTKSALKEFARVRNYMYEEQEMRDLVAEEILADGFMSYMENEGKGPKKGIIAALFDLLKKLISLFRRNGDPIEQTYSDIARGRYKKSAIQSGIFDGKVAFEVIEGVRKFTRDPLGSVIVQEIGRASCRERV